MTETLFLLAVLACPIAIGLMMWLMTRVSRNESAVTFPPATDEELIRLRAEVDRLSARWRDEASYNHRHSLSSGPGDR